MDEALREILSAAVTSSFVLCLCNSFNQIYFIEMFRYLGLFYFLLLSLLQLIKI